MQKHLWDQMLPNSVASLKVRKLTDIILELGGKDGETTKMTEGTLTAPTYDKLVLKHHRREQSQNPTSSTKVHDERRTESCERPNNDDEYNIIRAASSNTRNGSILSQSPET